MLDFIKEETEPKTMNAHVILSFDNVIHERGTQEIFYVDFAIANTCEETVYNMLLVINQYIDFHDLPKTELWKIDTCANWSEIASKHNLDIQIINDTNGKWHFGWKEHMTETEKALEAEFGFGRDVRFTDENVQSANMRIIQQLKDLRKAKNLPTSGSNTEL